jgi:membrane protease YdiL (CAAX protease family)
MGSRFVALLEVVFVFTTMHVCVKAVKQLTAVGAQERAAGLNFTPGISMTVAAILWISLKGRSWSSFGLVPVNTFQSMRTRLVVPVFYLIPLAVFLYYYSAGPFTATLVFLGHITVTAVGEELFFRGYVQSRLNWVFGRPWRVRGVSIGAGLVLAATLFGFLHALNTVDYFRGTYRFAWDWAGATLVMGVLFGFIREKTGSVIPCIIAHGLWNVWFLSVLIFLRR